MIDPFVLTFLTELDQNNNREWFAEHKADFEKAKKSFEESIKKLIKVIQSVDSSVNVEPKECIYRIYRDTRFSHNKIPYKNNMGAFIARGGRKSGLAGYYIHVEPGKCMFAAGVYGPDKDVLKAVRKEIFNFSDELKEIIHNPEFKATYPEMYPDKLKLGPKGFPKDFEDIDLLKYKSYIVMHNLQDKQLVGGDALARLEKLTSVAFPFIDYINRGIEAPEEDEISLD